MKLSRWKRTSGGTNGGMSERYEIPSDPLASFLVADVWSTVQWSEGRYVAEWAYRVGSIRGKHGPDQPFWCTRHVEGSGCADEATAKREATSELRRLYAARQAKR